MPTISIVTAVHEPAAEFLDDAYRSIVPQQLPKGWKWEWLVQEDGETETVSNAIPQDERVSFDSGRAFGAGLGAAAARNLALARSVGDVIKILDADDQLLPNALLNDLKALSQPNVGWTTSAVLDLLPDGSTATWDFDDPAGGRIIRGSMVDWWQAHDYRPQVHPATLAIHRTLIDCLGGWMALPFSEDTGLFLAASAATDGWFSEEPGMLYRKWPGQMTAGDLSKLNRADRHKLIQRRATTVADHISVDLPLLETGRPA